MPAAGGRVWFQLYVYRDREVTRGLVERVEAAGCKALVLTVDVPLLGRRERDVRNRFRLPDGLTARNLLPAGYDKIAPAPGDSGLAMYAKGREVAAEHEPPLLLLLAHRELHLHLDHLARGRGEDDARLFSLLSMERCRLTHRDRPIARATGTAHHGRHNNPDPGRFHPDREGYHGGLGEQPG